LRLFVGDDRARDHHDVEVLDDSGRKPAKARLLRPVAGDSVEADAVKVVARIHKTLIRERARHTQRLRHALLDYFPAALAAFTDEVVLSQPGVGPVLGARVLAEFGDDPTRYATAKARKNYAGTSPITRASGKKKVAPWSHHAEDLAA